MIFVPKIISYESIYTMNFYMKHICLFHNNVHFWTGIQLASYKCRDKHALPAEPTDSTEVTL